MLDVTIGQIRVRCYEAHSQTWERPTTHEEEPERDAGDPGDVFITVSWPGGSVTERVRKGHDRMRLACAILPPGPAADQAVAVDLPALIEYMQSFQELGHAMLANVEETQILLRALGHTPRG